jgi:hypothetical protein
MGVPRVFGKGMEEVLIWRRALLVKLQMVSPLFTGTAVKMPKPAWAMVDGATYSPHCSDVGCFSGKRRRQTPSSKQVSSFVLPVTTHVLCEKSAGNNSVK